MKKARPNYTQFKGDSLNIKTQVENKRLGKYTVKPVSII